MTSGVEVNSTADRRTCSSDESKAKFTVECLHRTVQIVKTDVNRSCPLNKNLGSVAWNKVGEEGSDLVEVLNGSSRDLVWQKTGSRFRR